MTSPYTPEFEFTDWPNGPLQAHLPGGSSPNVVLNEMSDEDRQAFAADYVRQGPAGRPAPAAD